MFLLLFCFHTCIDDDFSTDVFAAGSWEVASQYAVNFAILIWVLHLQFGSDVISFFLFFFWQFYASVKVVGRKAGDEGAFEIFLELMPGEFDCFSIV